MAYDNSKHSMEAKKRLYFPSIGMYFRKSEPATYAALQYAAKKTKVPPSEYGRKATIDRLISDGFLIRKDNGEYVQVIADEDGKYIIDV